MFSVGDIVWAKSSIPREIFWPSMVAEYDDDMKTGKRKGEVVAYVRFLAEDTYEAIRKASCVKIFNCPEKVKFLQRGLKNQAKRLLFLSALREAKGHLGKKNLSKKQDKLNSRSSLFLSKNSSPIISSSSCMKSSSPTKMNETNGHNHINIANTTPKASTSVNIKKKKGGRPPAPKKSKSLDASSCDKKHETYSDMNKDKNLMSETCGENVDNSECTKLVLSCEIRLQNSCADFKDSIMSSAVTNNMADHENIADESLVNSNEISDEKSSSDDDDLLQPISLTPAATNQFSPGDVVWVSYRKSPFWPAEVLRAGKKKNYYYIKYLPKTKSKGMQVPKNKMVLFSQSHEIYQQYRNQEVDEIQRKEFELAVEEAETILTKVFEKNGTQRTDEIENGQVSHVSEKNEPNEEQDNSDTSKRMSEKDIDRAHSPERSPHNLFDGNGNDDSDMDDETGQSYRTCLRKRKRTCPKYANILNDMEHFCKQRLLDIYHEKVYSWRHRIFKYGSTTERNNLQKSSGFGPVKDDEMCEKITNRIKFWYDTETKEKSITFDYVWGVWLPEAIIHYIQMIEKESRERAEEIYSDYRQHTDDDDVEDVKNYLKRKKVDEATREETLQRAKNLLT
ncbi:uncharacterized protein LOC124458506 isoform X2 [Xenia sp. Carnegie-2017]|uniref:uncharacterized protein LOC124458506 isoform X2 n=1 Tax=Xenia sp. Carnegie-2017 TaxID=2897299 RepID=UPI001F040262|nr:uncharacterized protein LOC124458506 isoform X2 [Xenia sp. Carnegie-2017]